MYSDDELKAVAKLVYNTNDLLENFQNNSPTVVLLQKLDTIKATCSILSYKLENRTFADLNKNNF